MSNVRAKKADPDIATCWVDCATIGFGFCLYILFSRKQVGPLGFVWGVGVKTESGTRFDVYGSYVHAYWRRCGIRTKINESILVTYDVVSSFSGSKPDGQKFMKATGYKFNADAQIWYLRAKKKAKKKR